MRISLFRPIALLFVFSSVLVLVEFLLPSPVSAQSVQAVADSFTIHVAQHLNVKENDVQGGYTTYHTLVDSPSHGTLSGSATGWMYYPDVGYAGADSFTYKLCVTGSCSNTVTVDISIVNVPPYPSGDFYIVPLGSMGNCQRVGDNDFETEGDGMSQGLIDAPTHGQVTGGTVNTCRFYYHAPHYETFDTYTYNVCDGTGMCSGPVSVNVYVTNSMAPLNYGPTCESVGEPVNVTTGNMWLRHSDYRLPGVGENIDVTRTYNSKNPSIGLFGAGWSSKYDESLQTFGSTYSDLLIQLNMPNGKAVMFGRATTNDPFVSFTSGVRASIVRNTDSTYTLTFKDGRVHKFDSTGKLLWQKDHNGNQTTLNYTSGVLTGVTDPFSRTLSISVNGSGNVTEISDSTGTVADYEYYTSSTRLKTVTYADGSKYKFEYTTVGSTYYLSTVKDALDNVLETHAYDSSGRATTSEKDGGVEEYTIDYTNLGSNQAVVTDGLNRVTTYRFERTPGQYMITEIEGACGCGTGGTETTTYKYDSRGNIVKKTDALLNETVYTYDVDSNLTSITDALGVQTFTYNSLGQILTHTDRMNGVTTNTYSSTGNLLTTDAIPQPTVNTTAITWTNKVGVAESPTGTITRNTGTSGWSGSGASSVEALSGNGTFKYVVGQTNTGRMIGLGFVDSNQDWTDLDFSFELRTDGYIDMYESGTSAGSAGTYSAGTVLEIERSGTTLYYKKNGVVQRTKTGVASGNLYVDTMIHTNGGSFEGVVFLTAGTPIPGGTTTYTYTSLGQLASVEDARENTTAFTYDTSGRLTKITDANNKETDFGYNTRARVTSVTNALDQTTEFEYDDKDRLERIIHPDTNDVVFEYDLAGRRTSITDERNNQTTYAYDDAYRLTSITDALSHTTTFGYDMMSNLTSQTDALGNATAFEYDDFDRLKKVVYPAPTASATPLQETFTYDKLGNVKTRVDTGGRTTSYDYDAASRLTKITDALSNDTQFTYDARSQMTKVKDDLNQEYTFTYDTSGNLLTQTRNGQTMTFTYDLAGNRITREDYNGNDTTYTYDALNRLTDITYSGSSEYADYTYDDLSRLLTAVNQNGTVTFTYNNRGRLASEEDVFGHDLEYTYDAAGNRTGLELNNTAHTAYAYDNANRLTTLTDEASNNFTFAYDNANRLTSRVAPNGITSTYEYDGMSRLKRLKHYNSTTTLYDDQFTFNTANQISQIAGLSQTRNYTYDNIDRLTGVSVGGSSVESYTYDAVGNRTASHLSGSYTTGSFNRLTATSSASYSYNANGSMTGKTVGSTNWTYGWDRESRMVSAGDGTNSATYSYDAIGRRVKRTQGSDVQKYTHDGLDVIQDDINSTLTKYQNGLGIDSKFKTATSSTSKYILQNHLGSSVGLANSSGNVTDSNSYDSFGNPTNGSFPSRYGHTGREIDPLSGQMFYRDRFYDANLGRFVSEDPIGFGGGDVNLYAHVWNDPLHFTDPMGLTGWNDYWEGAKEAGWRAGQAGIDALEAPIGFAVGFGDSAGLGIPRMIRDWQGIDNVNWDCYTSYNAGGWAGIAVDVGTGVGGLAKGGLKLLGKRAIKGGRFPKNPDDLLPNLPRDAKGRIYPSDRIRIRPESHSPKPGEVYSPRHHGQHYHVETRPNAQTGWGNKSVKKIKPPGYKPGDGTGFRPGEPFP